MTIQLVHTADWQIGKQFANVPGDAGAFLRRQRLETVAAIARLATERQADVVLVAGDVFEHNAVSDETLRRTLLALAGFEGPWILLPGNHDAALAQSVWSRMQRLEIVPPNVILAIEPGPISLCEGRLVIVPAPLRRRHDTRDLTAWFDSCRTDDGVFRVGLAHGAVTNRLPEQAESMNPIADDRAESARLDYLALGDWHGTLEIGPRTWYAGTPEPDRYKANDPGNLLLVELETPGGVPRVERCPVGRYCWRQETVELVDDQSLAVLAGRLSQIASADTTLLRLELRGVLSLAARQQLGQLLAEWRARLHYLEVDDSALLARPTADDIETMGATGFVREAVDVLREIEADPSNEERDVAALALQILYLEQRRAST